jgi:hypothetical protein
MGSMAQHCRANHLRCYCTVWTTFSGCLIADQAVLVSKQQLCVCRSLVRSGCHACLTATRVQLARH